MSGTFRKPRIPVILGTIAAVGPFTTDMYLPAFPAVGAELNATPAAVQGTLVTYFFALALGQLVYGPLSDRFGRRLPLLVGFGTYVLSSIGCALAQDIGSLALLRFLQALGGCSGMVIARAVVRDVSEGPAAIRLMANLMMVSGIAPVIAPAVGSLMLAVTGWRGIFGVLAIYGAVVVLLVLATLPESLPAERRRRDSPAAILVLFGGLLRERHFMAHALAGTMPIAGMFVYIIASPFVVMEIFGVSPQGYSLFFGANAAGIYLFGRIVSRLAQKHAAETLIRAFSWQPVLGGIVAMAGAVAHDFWLVAAGLWIFVAAIGALVPLAVATAMSRQGHAAGSASALIGTMQFGLGAGLGAAVGLLHTGTALPMAAAVALCGLGGFVALRVIAPRGV